MPILSIVMGATLLQLANGLLQVLLPLRMQAQGLTATEIGMVAAAYGFGFAIGCVLAPRFVRLFGFIRAFASLAALMAILALAFSQASHTAAWLLLRMLSGVCLAGLFTVAEGWISAQSRSGNRGQVLAVYMMSTKLALMLAPLLIGVMALNSEHPFMVLNVFLLISLLPVAFTLTETPSPPAVTALGLRALYRIVPSALVGSFTVGVVSGSMLALSPLYGLRIGLSGEESAALVIALQGGSLLTQWPLGWLSDRLDRRIVIAAVAAGTALLSVAIMNMAAPAPLWLVYLAFAGWGGLALCIYSLCVAHACDLVPAERIVATISGLLVAWAAGAMIGPLPGAMLMDRLGPAGLFLFAAVASAALAGFVVLRMAMQSRTPVKGRGSFVALPANSPTSATLTPHATSFKKD